MYADYGKLLDHARMWGHPGGEGEKRKRKRGGKRKSLLELDREEETRKGVAVCCCAAAEPLAFDGETGRRFGLTGKPRIL